MTNQEAIDWTYQYYSGWQPLYKKNGDTTLYSTSQTHYSGVEGVFQNNWDPDVQLHYVVGGTYGSSDVNPVPHDYFAPYDFYVEKMAGANYNFIGYKGAAPDIQSIGYNLFNKNSALTDYWESAASTYTSTSGGSPASSSARLVSNTPDGSWVALKLPYKICLKSYEFIGPGTKSPKEGQIWGTADGTTWSHVHTFTGGVTDVKNNETVSGNTKYYSEYAFITTKITGADTTARISQWRVFGTREQGQSVLHDGQLTLTKNLNVPRIGPALDADDTPRRDRLVVEYNTSTNPTFEGAVRDTSGRGNDGVFYGGSSYDATEKALEFDGVSDTIRGTQNIGTGEKILTMAMWIKRTAAVNTYDYVCNIGTSTTGQMAGFTINSNKFNFTKYGAQTVSTTTINNGQWYHLVGVYKGGNWTTTNAEIYVDGVKETVTGGTTSVLNLTGNQITFGDSTLYDGTSDFHGSISQFKLYDTALTAEEVKTLYDMGRTGSVANPQPLHIAAPLYSPGTIVQVENTLKLDTFLSAGGASTVTLQDVPGMSVTIHPKFENSKFLVSFVANVSTSGHAYLRVKRTQDGVSTQIAQPAAAGNRGVGVSYVFYYNSAGLDCYNFEYLDPTPLTSRSPITYQLQGYTFHSSYYFTINRGYVDTDNQYQGRASSTISVKEICH
jgi:hypothetical protein